MIKPTVMKRGITVHNPHQGRAALPRRPIVLPSRIARDEKSHPHRASKRSAGFPTCGFMGLSSPGSLTKKITKRTHFTMVNYSITTMLYPWRVRNHPQKRTQIPASLHSMFDAPNPPPSNCVKVDQGARTEPPPIWWTVRSSR